MNLDPAPRQSKLVYLAIDAGLLVTAFLIVFFARDPYAPLPFVSAVLCVVLAAIIGLVPFLIEYAADSAEYVQTERGRVTEQVQRLHAATESLARAAAQIKAVEEAVHKTAHAAENLPYRMQEKLAEFNETLAAKDSDDREALEQELEELRAAHAANLKTAAERIAKATAEWTALEATSRTRLTDAQAAAAKLADRLQVVLTQLEQRAVPAQLPVTPVNPKPAAPPEPPPPPEPAPAATVAPVIEFVPTPEPAPPAVVEEAKPRKPRPARKPRAEESPEPVADEPAAPDAAPDAASDDSEASPAEPETITELEPSEPESAPTAEAAASSDGATRLLVTAYIGIGNKLFIRGDGPGLSWDKGVPMQFVSIGKWGWASHDATAPVTCKLLKNDDTAALSGEVTLEPGKHVEVTALF